jgi:hypothetical protein
MQIDLSIDSTQLILRLKNGERRLAYAAVNAVNNTAKRIQQAEFAEVKDSFEIRKPTFFFGTPGRPGGTAARIKPFASVKQARAYADIAIAPPEGRGLVNRRTLLPYYESGGPRPIFTPGAQHVAVPIVGGPARPSWSTSVPKEFTFSGLHLVAFRQGKRVQRKGQRRSRQSETLFDTSGRATLPEGSGATQWKGAQRTFIIPASEDRKGGLYQRIGPKKIRLVYSFVDPAPLESRLLWIYTAQSVANKWFGEEMEREVINAIARARGVGL